MFVALFNAMRQFADSLLRPSVGMWILISGNAVNIVFNYLLIYGKCGMPELGALGAGISTLGSRVLMTVVFAVVLLPVLVVNDVGMGDPFFCKYICPQGVLEGAIPLAIANAGIRSALGRLFTWKLAVLIAVVVLSVLFYRPFCKWICPLGAFYAWFNLSLIHI